MSSLIGFLGQGPWCEPGAAPALLQRMSGACFGRVPSGASVWRDDEAGIGLAQLPWPAPAGVARTRQQPIICHSGRYVLTLSGRVDNHLDLRQTLQAADLAPAWRGASGGETLLAGFVAWGVRATIERCVGTFAFALWDRQERMLTLGRDRIGEQPLYYGWQGQGATACFLFGSDLNALKVHPAFAASIDRGALCLFMRHGYINAPQSIYRSVQKLPPAHLLTVTLQRREVQIEAYWSLIDQAVSGAANPLPGNTEQIADQLEALLHAVVRQKTAAGESVGAFLSGGVDSSTVVALLQAQSDRPVKTFAIGFDEADYNEAEHAKAVARHLGTDHSELHVTAERALDVIRLLPALYGEPFADASQIPTFIASQLAREQVAVVLSGDAGDELFGGYKRYLRTRNLWGKMSRLPRGLRTLAASGIRAVPPSMWNLGLRPVQPFMPRSLRQANMGDKLHKGARVLLAQSVDEVYLRLVTHWEPDGLVIDGQEPATCLRGHPLPLPGLDAVQRMMALDGITYLPGDGLTKVERAASGAGLQVRGPLLDHRVVELAWRIPQSMKLRGNVGKWILRQVLYRHVPRELIDRPKMGFGVPLDRWLRGPLRDWAENLLDEARLRDEGFFNPAPIRQKWLEHLSGKRNWQYHLWDVLMFQLWLENQ